MRRSSRRVRVAAAGAAAASVALALSWSVPVEAGAQAGWAPASAGSGRTSLTYCRNGGVPETLDVFEPSPTPTAAPAVVYVHGGGWVQGDAALTAGSLVARVETAVVEHGWVFVSIDYRLAPRARWPAQIDDAACAVRFLRARSAALHIDPRHIGAVGDSAGGQIAALLGLAGPSAGFDVGAWAHQSSAVQAVVDLYGPADLTTSDWQSFPLIQVYAAQAFGTRLGPQPPGSPAARLLESASPVHYVGPHAPPFLIVQGSEDSVVPPDQSRQLADRLTSAGDDAELVMVRNAEHGLLPTAGGPETPTAAQVVDDVVAFMVRHLRSAPPPGTRTEKGGELKPPRLDRCLTCDRKNPSPANDGPQLVARGLK